MSKFPIGEKALRIATEMGFDLSSVGNEESAEYDAKSIILTFLAEEEYDIEKAEGQYAHDPTLFRVVGPWKSA